MHESTVVAFLREYRGSASRLKAARAVSVDFFRTCLRAFEETCCAYIHARNVHTEPLARADSSHSNSEALNKISLHSSKGREREKEKEGRERERLDAFLKTVDIA